MSTESGKVKILWTHDSFSGPENGLALYGEEKVWFCSLAVNPELGKIQETEQPGSDLIGKKAVFALIRLDADKLAALEENHLVYTQATGRPLLHGDPHPVRKVAPLTRKVPTNVPVGENSVEAQIRALNAGVVKVDHNYNPLAITGEIIAYIKEDDFSNFYVPHQVAKR